MFWRKKQTDEFEIEVDDESADAAERRDAFRIGADPGNPVRVTIDGTEYNASNISSGGLAVRSHELCEGRKYTIRLQLPDASPVIHTELIVVSIGAQGLCRCKFRQLSQTSQNALQRYILGREKEKIRARTSAPEL